MNLRMKLNEPETGERQMRPRNLRAIQDRQRTQEMEYHQRIMDKWMETVPDEYVGYGIKNIEEGWASQLDPTSQTRLLRYLRTGADHRFLVLQGPAGVGKSTLAITIATHLLETRGMVPEYRLTPTLLQDFSFGFHDGVNHLHELSRVPMLILDDLGAGNPSMTEHQRRNMWALIDARWSNKNLRTIITTNMATSGSREGVGLREWLGETSWDRVSHDMLRISLDGESLRTSYGFSMGRLNHL